jgi:tetratricopeptide (TPR) repeat protein
LLQAGDDCRRNNTVVRLMPARRTFALALSLVGAAGAVHAEPCGDAVQKAGISGSTMARCLASERPDVAVLACTELILGCQGDPRWLEQLHVLRAGAHLQNYVSTGDQRSEDAALKDCAFVLSFNPNSDLAYAKRGDVYKAAGDVGQAAGDYKTALAKSHDEKLKAVVAEKLKTVNTRDAR